MVGEELEGTTSRIGRRSSGAAGILMVFSTRSEISCVAMGGDGDDLDGAVFNLLNIGVGLLVL
jgi:TPP-dependent pyruvate/acetoin dehydrogenase alpha subunit